MTINTALRSSIACLVILLALPLVVQADPPKKLQSGEIGGINLEGKDDPNTYKKVQARVIKKLDELEAHMLKLAAGSRAEFPNFDKYELSYLATAYLYCSMQTGVCPRVLQAVFEVDFINSEVSNTNKCPNLTYLWKKWIENDMDKRLEYKLRVAEVARKQKFNKEARPKFVKCRKTIGLVRENYPEGINIFEKRYQEGSTQIRALQKTQALIKVLQKKVRNIFHKTGTK